MPFLASISTQKPFFLQGSDSGGSYDKLTTSWTAGSTTFYTYVRVYDSHAIFGQYYPEAVANVSVNDRDKVTAAFPTFDYSQPPAIGQPVGVVAFKGDMTGSATQAYSWEDFPSNVGTGSAMSGVLVFFSKNLNTSLVVSAFSNFMTHTTEVGAANDLIFGIGGATVQIPAGYSIETVSFGKGHGGKKRT